MTDRWQTLLILADEINRAPAKVQSALLKAMQERQVTIGEYTYPLDDPFLGLATQNSIEQEGCGADISEALGYLNRVVCRRSVVFLVSDLARRFRH